MKMLFLIVSLLVLSTTSHSAASKLVCKTGNRGGTLNLNFFTKEVSIEVYCHMSGCSGKGKIIRQTSNTFEHTFVLEMNMEMSNLEYMILKLDRAVKTAILKNHPELQLFSNCALQ